MSYTTWHDYGYGICTDDIKEHNVERLQNLLKLAPRCESKIQEYLAGAGISDPVWEDYMEYDQDFNCRLATIFMEVIEEAEGICMTSCSDYNCKLYLIYQAKYPWAISEEEKALTQEGLTDIFARYVGVLTDEAIDIDYQSVENGG